MNWELLRKEWGAVAFVITVLVGLVVVPVTLYLGNQSPTASISTSAEPSPSPSLTPSPLASPTPSPAPSPTPSPLTGR